MLVTPIWGRLQPLLQTHSAPVYLVGGAVRDALLGRPGHDLDFVTAVGAVRLAFRVGNSLDWPAFTLDAERDIGRVVAPAGDLMLDFAAWRGDSLLADLSARDFTINALALPVAATGSEALIDPCGGAADLRAGVIRCTSPQALLDDPVRTLRGVRLAAELGFRLTPETITATQTAAGRLEQVSPERRRDEFVRLLAGPTPAEPLAQMADWGLLAPVIPEAVALIALAQSPPHHEPVWAHTLSVLHWLEALEGWTLGAGMLAGAEIEAALGPFRPALAEHLRRPVGGGLTGRHLLRLGALFHDVGKAATRSITPEGRIRFLGHEQAGALLTEARLQALRFSRDASRYVAQIVAGHMRPLSLAQAGGVSRRAAYRFFKGLESAGLDVGLLALADHLATYAGVGEGEAWRRLLETVTHLMQFYFERAAEVVRPAPLVRGQELMRVLGMAAGPDLGQLLQALEEGQAAGEISTHEEALAYARAWLAKEPIPDAGDGGAAPPL